MKTIVLTLQEDDGGAHNCFAIGVTDDQFKEIERLSQDVCDDDDIQAIVSRATIFTDFPMMVDAIFNIWYRY